MRFRLSNNNLKDNAICEFIKSNCLFSRLHRVFVEKNLIVIDFDINLRYKVKYNLFFKYG